VVLGIPVDPITFAASPLGTLHIARDRLAKVAAAHDADWSSNVDRDKEGDWDGDAIDLDTAYENTADGLNVALILINEQIAAVESAPKPTILDMSWDVERVNEEFASDDESRRVTEYEWRKAVDRMERSTVLHLASDALFAAVEEQVNQVIAERTDES
jgi:hypothetical protein